MANLETLIEQRDAVDREIATLRAQALASVRALMAEYQLDPSDIFGKKRSASAPDHARRRADANTEPRYRDPATGQTWVGRGKRPQWLRAHVEAGRSLDEFRL